MSVHDLPTDLILQCGSPTPTPSIGNCWRLITALHILDQFEKHPEDYPSVSSTTAVELATFGSEASKQSCQECVPELQGVIPIDNDFVNVTPALLEDEEDILSSMLEQERVSRVRDNVQTALKDIVTFHINTGHYKIYQYEPEGPRYTTSSLDHLLLVAGLMHAAETGATDVLQSVLGPRKPVNEDAAWLATAGVFRMLAGDFHTSHRHFSLLAEQVNETSRTSHATQLSEKLSVLNEREHFSSPAHACRRGSGSDCAIWYRDYMTSQRRVLRPESYEFYQVLSKHISLYTGLMRMTKPVDKKMTSVESNLAGSFRDLFAQFGTVRFHEAFVLLDRLIPRLRLDPFISRVLDAIIQASKRIALLQYTSAFSVIKISTLTDLLLTGPEVVIRELERGILDKKLDGRLDLVDGDECVGVTVQKVALSAAM